MYYLDTLHESVVTAIFEITADREVMEVMSAFVFFSERSEVLHLLSANSERALPGHVLFLNTRFLALPEFI